MGQHKYNPTAQAARRGELPPKPVKIGRRESDRRMMALIDTYMLCRTGISPGIIGGLYDKPQS